jgi:predicted GNAT family acetyltransferase
VQLSRFDGVFDSGRLISMAGTRFSTPHWREIGSVGTLPEYRGRGIAGALVHRLRSDIEASGRRAWLHVHQDPPAVRLYRRLGFVIDQEINGDVLAP